MSIKRWLSRPIDKLAMACSLFLIAIVTLLSLLPNEELPQVIGSDKVHHFIAYCAVILPISTIRFSFAAKLAPAYILYSGLIELFQPLSNRYAEWADFGVNTLGIILGLIIGRQISPIVFRYIPERWKTKTTVK